MMLWTGSASAGCWDSDATGEDCACHVESRTSVMVLKTFASNCLTLEEDYPRVRMERDEWRKKYEQAEDQVFRLLSDRDRLTAENQELTKYHIQLSESLAHWRSVAGDRWTTWEVIGVGATGLAVGSVLGVLLWLFVVPSL